MGSFSVFHWLVMVLLIGIAVGLIWVVRLLRKPQEPPPAAASTGEVPNTFKFRTVVFLILAVILPFWPVTLPLFLYLAYRSYVAGDAGATPATPFWAGRPAAPPKVAAEIEALHRLLLDGALSESEFRAQKARLLGHPGAGERP